jgi:hypothetical protein
VYFGSEDNYLYCLNASTGEKIWASPTGYWIWSSPAVADGNVYVGSEDYNFYCFNASTGEQKWSFPTGGAIDSSPAVANGNIYFGSDDCTIYALTNSPNAPTPPKDATPPTVLLFDAIASVVAVAVICGFAFTAHSTMRANHENKKGQGAKSWVLAHADALCILAILAFQYVLYRFGQWFHFGLRTNKPIPSGLTTWLKRAIT